MSNIIIGFTGTRNGLNEEQIKQIKLILDKYDNITVRHGDCIGADTDFHNLCLEYKNKKNIKIQIHPPNDPKLRKYNKADILMLEKPYLERNLDIIIGCNFLIGCPFDKNNEKIRSGTWYTIRQARKRNIKTYIF